MRIILLKSILLFSLLLGGVVLVSAHSHEYQTVPNRTASSAIPPTVQIQPDSARQSQCINCTYVTYRLVQQLNCGATIAIEDVLNDSPTCKLVPRVTHSGAIILEWDTAKSVTAFIDTGVGHVALKDGSRIVTPTSDTTYSMTVISESGVVGACSAIINVSNAKAQTNTISILGEGIVPSDPYKETKGSLQTEDDLTIIGNSTTTTDTYNTPWYKNFVFKVSLLVIVMLIIFFAALRFALRFNKN